MVDTIRNLKTNQLFRPQSFRADSGTTKHSVAGAVYQVINPLIDGILSGLGLCQLRYVANRNGSAFAAGELVAFLAAETITNLDSGGVNQGTKAATFTADEYEGRIVFCLDNNSGAGAAPEGESAIIVAGNTAARIDFEPDFTVALAANDDLIIFTRQDVDDAADGDFQQEVCGVVPSALADNSWGWVICHGHVRNCLIKAATGLTASQAVVADAARVTAPAGDLWGLHVGYMESAVTSDIVADYAPVFIDCLYGSRGGTGTLGTYTQTYATADRTISAYTADDESTSYTGSNTSTTNYLTITDGNALRVAYENLRALAEDTTAALNSVIDDLQTAGMFA